MSVDGIIEAELRRFLAIGGVNVFVTRIGHSGDTSANGLRHLQNDIPAAATAIIPGRKLDVIAFGCTSGAMEIGPQIVADSIQRARPNTPVVDPVSASLAALAHLGVRRAAVLTPYIDGVNAVVENDLTSHGLIIGACASFKQAPAVINRISEADVRDAAIELGRRDVDGVFISCTGLRCAGILNEIEATIGKPVIASHRLESISYWPLDQSFDARANARSAPDALHETRLRGERNSHAKESEGVPNFLLTN